MQHKSADSRLVLVHVTSQIDTNEQLTWQLVEVF